MGGFEDVETLEMLDLGPVLLDFVFLLYLRQETHCKFI